MVKITNSLKILIVIIILLYSCCYPVLARAALLTYEFDDGWASQWTGYEILSKYNQVAVAAVPAIVLVKENQFKKTALSRQKLLTMQSAGWEIASHSWSHPHFNNMPQTYLEASLTGQRRIHDGKLIFASASGFYHRPALLLDGKVLQPCSSNRTMEKVPGSYFIQPGSGNIVIHPHVGCDPSTAAIMTPSVQWELESSKTYLNNLGFNVQNISVPYHEWSSGRARLAKLYYNSASTGWSSVNGGTANKIPIVDPYWLARVGIASYTSVAQVKKHVTRAIEKNEWLILLLHKIDDSGNTYAWSPAKFEELVKWISEQNIQVVTRQQGLDLAEVNIKTPRGRKQGLCTRSTGAQ